MRVQAAPDAHLDWLTERTTYVPTAGCRAIEAIDGAGKIRGMVAYDHWAKNSVQMHVALDAPIVARSLLAPAFGYPFEMVGLGVVIGIVPAENTKSAEHARRLGFTETHRIKDGWDVGSDLIVFEMRKENCRWLKGKA